MQIQAYRPCHTTKSTNQVRLLAK